MDHLTKDTGETPGIDPIDPETVCSSLGPIEAVEVSSGRQVQVETGWEEGIVIVGESNGVIRLRRELPLDMACGRTLEELSADERRVQERGATYFQAPVDAFVDSDGHLKLSVSYWKGC